MNVEAEFMKGKPGHVCGWSQQHPEVKAVKTVEMHVLTEADKLLLIEMGEPTPLFTLTEADWQVLREKGGDHFYGAWRGGKASAGGGPATGGVTAEEAIKALERGERPTVAPGDVAAVMDMAAKRTDNLDLTELQVDGTLKFGGDGLGIARKDMPQLSGANLDKYLDELRARGIKVKMGESVAPQLLKPSQKEVSLTATGKIVQSLRTTGYDKSKLVVVSSDNFVIDGHHRWSAATAFSFEKAGKDLTIPVVRVDMKAKRLLKDANAWTASQGIASKALGEAAYYALTLGERDLIRD